MVPLRAALTAHAGHVFKTVGGACYAVFVSACGAPFVELYSEVVHQAGCDWAKLPASINSQANLADTSWQAADESFASF